MKKILLTGGGTAGHVTPNIALLPDLIAEGYDIHYIGSYEGLDKKLITAQGIHYDGIATGKFRRYLSAKNLTDPFRVIKGFQQAKKLIRDYKPDAVLNVALPFQELTIMDACLACKVDYIDTANYEPEDTDDPAWRAIYEKRCKEAGFTAYFDYTWQWA